MHFLVLTVVKLADPIGLALSIIGGAFCRSWAHVAIVAVAVAGIIELMLFSMQATRVFNPVSFLAGVAASGAWASVAFGVKLYRKRRQA